MGEPSGTDVPPEIAQVLKSCSKETMQCVYETLSLLDFKADDAESRVVDTWYVALEAARDSADHFQILSASLAAIANLQPVRDCGGNPLPIYNLQTWSELA